MGAPLRPRSVIPATLLMTSLALPAVGAEPPAPSEVGSLTAPFDEGFGEQPRCEVEEDGNVLCQPAAVSTAILPDGRVLYWSGIENTEGNVETLVLFEAGRTLGNSQASILDFSGEFPGWTDAGRGVESDNPSGSYETPIAENPLGVIGGGRPGDGFTGSTVGQLFPTDPVAPTDDERLNDADMFCSDLTQLPDGTILVAGGTDFYSTGAQVPEDQAGIGGMGLSEIGGIRTTQIFDPTTDTWTEVEPMKYARWYPTLTTLPNGDVHVASGVTRLVADSQLSQVRRTETWDVEEGGWTENYTGPASENSLPMYPRTHLTPNGKVFYAAAGQLNGFGPTGYAADEALWGLYQFFNTDTSEWEVAGATQWAGLPRGGAFSTPLMMEAPYDEMDILIGGGTLGGTPGTGVGMSLSEIVTVGEDDSVDARATEDMNHPRWFTTGVLLPDGQVLASGGGNIDHVIASGLEAPVHELELFDPETETWTEGPSLSRDRTYHNSATLLPDGRVLIGGHSPIMTGIAASHQDVGGAMANNNKDWSFEVYSPPYLHRGERPTIDRAPAGIPYGETFDITSADAADVESVRLIRVPTQTHTIDADQRGVDLPFTVDGDTLTVEAPPTGTVAPVGKYYLFINSSTEEGPVPSVASIVDVGRADDAPAFTPSYDSAAVASKGAASPTNDSNMLTGIMTRNYPAPGLEGVLLDIIEASSPQELEFLLSEASPLAKERMIETLTPAGLGNLLLDKAGADLTFEELSDQGFDAVGAPLTEIFQSGVDELGLVSSQLLSTTLREAPSLQSPELQSPIRDLTGDLVGDVTGGLDDATGGLLGGLFGG